MKYYVRQYDDADGDLWQIAQDVKRLSDTLSSYNLALSFVDKTTWQPIELDFQISLLNPDGMVEGEYNEQRTDSQPKQCTCVHAPGVDHECWCC